MTQIFLNGGIARVAQTLVTIIALNGICSVSFAAIVDDLYSVKVSRNLDLVPGQMPRTLEEETRFAMSQLLVRVTGRVDAALEPDLADMLVNASDYTSEIGPLDRETLLVTFNPLLVEPALMAREQPIWGSERPLTLLWLALDSEWGERGILSAGELTRDLSPAFLELQAELREELAMIALDRGLLLSLPLLDLEDMNALSFVDIWAGFNNQITRASERYGVDAIVSIRMRVNQFGVDVRWTLLKDGDQFALAGNSIREGLDSLGDFYAAEFSTLGGARETAMKITGVDSLDDYGRVMRYLESLSLVDAVAAEELVDSALFLRVNARGGREILGRVVGLSRLLSLVDLAPGEEPGRESLTFTFNP
ncbi:MAG: DUF2066 domain-containing protein [Candidatus Rariloculaceae bacterium]